MFRKHARAGALAIGLLSAFGALHATSLDLKSEFSGQGTVGNTRHNMTHRATSGSTPTGAIMDAVRNNYEEVCVYCHTPHGANQHLAAPLWNRTVRTTTYTLYAQTSLSGDVTQPGSSSLTCLSCHDGQTAIDSILNMPGSGKYNAALALDPSAVTTSTLLDAWKPDDDAWDHWGLNQTGCLTCHSGGPGSLNGATNFTVAALGTDLSNDHPVGVKLPTSVDFAVTTGTYKNLKYFDQNGNSRPDKNELRFYNTGDGHEVECASCHDPHGVPGPDGVFLPTFLRVTSEGSQICLTCHIK